MSVIQVPNTSRLPFPRDLVMELQNRHFFFKDACRTCLCVFNFRTQYVWSWWASWILFHICNGQCGEIFVALFVITSCLVIFSRKAYSEILWVFYCGLSLFMNRIHFPPCIVVQMFDFFGSFTVNMENACTLWCHFVCCWWTWKKKNAILPPPTTFIIQGIRVLYINIVVWSTEDRTLYMHLL